VEADEYHVPVMPHECAGWLVSERTRVLVDATVGHGGHALILATRMTPGGLLVIVDARPEALAIARKRLEGAPVQVIAIEGNFRRLAAMLRERGIREVDGVLYDQGLSSADYEGELGYSFQRDAPLDMRRDESATRSAARLLATLSRRELARVLRDYGDEKWSDRIADFVVRHREREPIERTSQFVRLVEAAVPRAAWPPDTHVATRSMMALRYAVNDDLGAIAESIEGVAPTLTVGGRIVCLSFCGTEDRAVKETFRRLERPCTCPKGLAVCACGRIPVVKVLTRRAVRPSPEEQARNRRSRTARARAAERI